MSSNTTTKVRLVRCPKCRLILPEIPNIPVYQCGGCFTTLQAKSQRPTAPSLPETPVVENNNLNHVSEDRASSSSSHETPLQSLEITGSDQNPQMGQTESGDINSIPNIEGENIESENQSNPSDQDGSEGGSGDGEKLEQDIIGKSKQVGSAELSNEDHNSGSYQRDSSTSNDNHVPEEQQLQENGSEDGFGDGEKLEHGIIGKSDEQVGSGNLSNEDHSSDCYQHDSSTSNENHSPKEQEFRENGELLSARTHITVEDNGASSSVATKIEAETDVESHIGSTEIVNARGSHLRSADSFYDSPSEQLEKIQERTLRGLDRLRSTETVYISSNEQLDQPPTDAIEPSSELSSALIDLSKSPTTRSSRAYYDDGISSHEGTDDQLHNRHKHGSKQTHRVPISSNYRAQPHFRSSASIPTRNWNNLERDEYLPRHQVQNEFYYSSDFASPDRAAHVEQEKAKLLRMVSELQDQLNKATLVGEPTARVNWKNHQRPVYYDHQENLFNPVHPPSSGGLANWSQQRKFSRIPFSADAAINRHRTDHSMNNYPTERNWSARLPPSGVRYSSRSNLYSSYGSCPSSPQHVGPQFHMYGGKAKSDDQLHREHGARKYLREQPRMPKRHLRPLAGGAPFVTCAYCSNLLQLPAEFLLFKKKIHRLKCGYCLEVLKFSLENNARLVPYEPVAEASPPSEVDEHEHSDSIHRRRNFSSTSHVTGCPSVSCSDDCKSCSQGRKMSNGLVDYENERKVARLNEARSKGKAPVEYESAGTSHSKSEIEELGKDAERRRNSPLHRLMGYSSARYVIYS